MKDRSKAGKRSKAKGSQQERKIAKLLTSWWGKENVSFRRTPGSGGWATAAHVEDKFGASGDIICSDPSFPFCIEIKHYSDIRLEHLITSTNPLILQWWDQVKSSTPSHLNPWLCIKRNNAEELVILSASDFPSHKTTLAELVKGMKTLRLNLPEKEYLTIITLKDFFTIPPSLISLDGERLLP